MENSLLVAFGGAIGAVLRYFIGMAMRSLIPHYAASGTLLVNVIGCLLIGCLLGLPQSSRSISESARLFLVVGILGGLTTFSSLAHETVELSHRQGAGLFAGLGHLSANVILGLTAVVLGAWLSRDVSRG